MPHRIVAPAGTRLCKVVADCQPVFCGPPKTEDEGVWNEPQKSGWVVTGDYGGLGMGQRKTREEEPQQRRGRWGARRLVWPGSGGRTHMCTPWSWSALIRPATFQQIAWEVWSTSSSLLCGVHVPLNHLRGIPGSAKGGRSLWGHWVCRGVRASDMPSPPPLAHPCPTPASPLPHPCSCPPDPSPEPVTPHPHQSLSPTHHNTQHPPPPHASPPTYLPNPYPPAHLPNPYPNEQHSATIL